jgi:hypothetical protein
MVYQGQRGIACCIYGMSAMLTKTKETNVSHLCGMHTPKLITTFAIFQSADGRIGRTVCDMPAIVHGSMHSTVCDRITRRRRFIKLCSLLRRIAHPCVVTVRFIVCNRPFQPCVTDMY